MEVLRKEIGLHAPYVSENGGGIFFPPDCPGSLPPQAERNGDTAIWPLGLPYRELVLALKAIRRDLGWEIIGFSDMTPEEISRETGLGMLEASLASRREFDEPFFIKKPGEPPMDLLLEAASRRGIRVTRGGRFFHLLGKNDKGEAVDRLIAWYRRANAHIRTIALGDSPNDFAMLRRVQFPVLVSKAWAQEAQSRVPGVRMSPKEGPRGWNMAVTEILLSLDQENGTAGA
jgi:mannosyl-3-phosphoglycerate phosphatase